MLEPVVLQKTPRYDRRPWVAFETQTPSPTPLPRCTRLMTNLKADLCIGSVDVPKHKDIGLSHIGNLQQCRVLPQHTFYFHSSYTQTISFASGGPLSPKLAPHFTCRHKQHLSRQVPRPKSAHFHFNPSRHKHLIPSRVRFLIPNRHTFHFNYSRHKRLRFLRQVSCLKSAHRLKSAHFSPPT